MDVGVMISGAAIDWQPTLTLDNLVNAAIAVVAVGFAWWQFRRGQSARVIVAFGRSDMSGEGVARVQLLVSNAGAASAWAVLLEVVTARGPPAARAMVRAPMHPGSPPVEVEVRDVPADVVRALWAVRASWNDGTGQHRSVTPMIPTEPDDHVPLVQIV